ncbi:MAG: acyltransferase, partial [Pseudomonadota bacterium]
DILALGGTLAWQARRPGVGIPGLDTLGDASYAIYLSHTVVLIPLGLVLPMLGLPLPITVIVAIIICAIAGWLLHVTVERPMTIALRQRFDRAANKGTS